jgi:uncharacterized protein YecT (DUF1311 family)
MRNGPPWVRRIQTISLLACLAAAAPATAAETYGIGSISGVITIPGDSVPALRIYAFAIDGMTHRRIETTPNQAKFTIDDVPAGRYRVVGYVDGKAGSNGNDAVAWTHAARCVKGPCDHSLIEVKVVAGKISTGVVLADWYVPPGILPRDPDAPRDRASTAPECEKEHDQAGRDGCHLRAHQAADQDVVRHYRRVMRALQPYPRCRDDLRKAQFAWEKFREQQCAYEGVMGEKGRTVRCLRELTEARAAYLEGQTPVGCNR